MWILAALACATPDTDTGPAIDLPGHNECLPEGEEMQEETCLAVVADAGRYPTVSENKSGAEASSDDPRLTDEDYQWITATAKRCTCSCCHTSRWGGAGVYFWDLDFSPVWVDSASLWSLSVFGGFTEEDFQTLPADDMERLQTWLEGEADRRRALDADAD